MTTPNWHELLTDLNFYTGSYPEQALSAALTHPQVSRAPLLAELAACASDPTPRTDDDEGWMLHLYAMHLLAAQRDTEAFAPLLAIARLDGEVLEQLLGDHLTEGLPRALAATCPAGEEVQLQALANDASCYLWSRSAALRALALRALEGDYPREALLSWLKTECEREADRMVDGGLRPEQGTDTDHLSELVITLEEIGASELAESVQAWFDDGLIDDSFTKPEDCMVRLQRDWATCQADELAHGWGYPRDILGEISRWTCFHPDEDDEEMDEDDAPKQEPVVRDAPKVGRNDPCPCGSGKKYKKCCGAG
ncbi:DUF1186 domain-containing protein [Chitinimonas sp.]|uniref:DUF1186 domain-containing protein n=1 Tax=Chitinimonas sp. TaxID=1934313 RepID=UPI0035AF586C